MAEGSLFDEVHYISPEQPEDFMSDFVEGLKGRPGYSYAVNRLHAGGGTRP
jgi:hypothetical protein